MRIWTEYYIKQKRIDGERENNELKKACYKRILANELMLVCKKSKYALPTLVIYIHTHTYIYTYNLKDIKTLIVAIWPSPYAASVITKRNFKI